MNTQLVQNLQTNNLSSITEMRSIYLVGAYGLLNTAHVMLALSACGTKGKKIGITILDPSGIEFADWYDSNYIDDVISDYTDILNVLKHAPESDPDFVNIIMLEHYDWLKNSLDPEYSRQAIEAVKDLVKNVRNSNTIFIVCDRNVQLGDNIPDFDAILCFRLLNEKISKHVIGQPGAELLFGKGETLYCNRRTNTAHHAQVPLLTDELSELFKNGRGLKAGG